MITVPGVPGFHSKAFHPLTVDRLEKPLDGGARSMTGSARSYDGAAQKDI